MICNVTKVQKVLYFLFSLLLVSSCEEKQTIDPSNLNENKFLTETKPEKNLEKSLTLPIGTVTSPIGNLTSVNAKFYSNIVYNPNDPTGKSKFDIFIPNTATDLNHVPLVIYLHGGGFENGLKEDAYDIERNPYVGDIKKYLKKGIAFATIGYRSKPDFPGFDLVNRILNCMGDVKRCLQFMRYNHSDLKIIKDKVGVFGGSSGASTSIWLGLKDDMASTDINEINADPVLGESTRIQAVGHLNSQCSFEKQYLIDEYFNAENSCLFPGPVQPAPELHFPSFMTSDDPDLFIYNDKPIDCSNTDAITHHPYHAILLKEKVDEVWPTGISSGKVLVKIVSYNIPATGTIIPNKNKTLFNFMVSRLK